jgi:hypothetical protein
MGTSRILGCIPYPNPTEVPYPNPTEVINMTRHKSKYWTDPARGQGSNYLQIILWEDTLILIRIEVNTLTFSPKGHTVTGDCPVTT